MTTSQDVTEIRLSSSHLGSLLSDFILLNLLIFFKNLSNTADFFFKSNFGDVWHPYVSPFLNVPTSLGMSLPPFVSQPSASTNFYFLQTAGIADQAAVEATVVVQAMMKDGEVEKTKSK